MPYDHLSVLLAQVPVALANHRHYSLNFLVHLKLIIFVIDSGLQCSILAVLV